MRRNRTIYKSQHTGILHFISLILVLAASLLIPLDTFAQWDGVSSEIPQGAGTQDSPYLISKPEHFEWLRQNCTSTNTFNGNHFLVTEDIDFANNALTPVAMDKANTATGFQGHIDGNGHMFSNFKIYWNNVNTTIGFGLFTYLAEGSITNLTIKNATLTRTVNGTLTHSNDPKIGILAGAIGPRQVLKNINLVNCRIDDGNLNGKPYTLYVGGLVGDIANGFCGTSDFSETQMPTISNISAQVDIDLSHTTRTSNTSTANSKRPQFNVGGIIGRVRRAPTAGTNMLYSGKINAPAASVGPIFSLIRFNGNNDVRSLAKAYAGEKNSSGAALYDYTVPPTDMFFYNYEVWNPVATTPGYERMSDTYPEGGEGWIYGTRTFLPNDIDLEIVSGYEGGADNMNSTAVWSPLQGVNRGKSIDGDSPSQQVSNIRATLQKFNDESGQSEFSWDYDEALGHIVYRPMSYQVSISQSDIFDFEGTLTRFPADAHLNSLRYKWSAGVIKSDGTSSTMLMLAMETPEIDPVTNKPHANISISSDTFDQLRTLNGGTDFDIFADFYLRLDLYIHDANTGTDSPITFDGEPVFITSHINRPVIATALPFTYTAPVEVGGETVTIGSTCFLPKVTIGAHDLSSSDQFVYKWYEQSPDGTWRLSTSPHYVEGQPGGYFSPTAYNRQIAVELISADGDILLGRKEITLHSMKVRIKPIRSDDADEQVYRMEAYSDYDGKVFDLISDVEWSCDIAGYTLTDDECSTLITNSSIPATLKTYTLTAVVSRGDAEHTPLTATYQVERIKLYFNEERDASNTQCFRAVLALAYNTTPTSPNKFTGSVDGTWKWYVSGLGNDDTFQEVTQEVAAAEGLTIVTDPDGLESRLYGYDNVHLYKVVWTSDSASYAHADGSPIELAYQKSLSMVIYVYDKERNERYSTASDFSGIDHEGNPYPNGDDTNSGLTPWTALRTLEEAYKRLPPANKMSDNRIVLMGAVGDTITYKLIYNKLDNTVNYAKPATVCGKYYALERDGTIKPTGEMTDYGGTLLVFNGAPIYNKTGTATAYTSVDHALGAPTAFADLKIQSVGGNNMMLYAYGNDLLIDKGVIVSGFRNVSSPVGLGLKATDVLPEFTIVAGKYNYNQTTDDFYKPLNVDPYLVTITVRSGCFARIIGTSRNNVYNAISHNICGTPDNPFRSHIIIDIDDDNNYKSNSIYNARKYTHDIGLVTGGQTDGSVYADVNIEIHKGFISTYIAGNISYGRSVGDSHPDDTFFGRTILSLYGGTVADLYGGSLGRYDCTGSDGAGESSPYFYGTSIINIHGGEIHNNLYGAGAGGSIGVGHKSNTRGIVDYSPDRFIPYYDENGQLVYGTYDQASAVYATIPNIRARIRDFQGQPGEVDEVDNFVDIDLVTSHVEVNIYGGTIYGNVFGGGYGHSTSMNVQYAPYGLDTDGRKIGVAGNVYGNTRVTVHGGRIFGNVYGGGAGSNEYQKAADKLGLDIDFTKLAMVFGDSEVIITGGQVGLSKDDFANYSDILDLTKTPNNFYDTHGNVYGGGEGDIVHSYMAATFGNTDVAISGGTIYGNVFGGSDFSHIYHFPLTATTFRPNTGNTNVTIDGGTIGDSIFGGSRGADDNDMQSNALISGDTHVTINGGSFLGTPYINEINNLHGYRNFNIYGGGLANCTVEGNAYVRVNSSLMNDMGSFMPYGENPNEWPDAISEFQAAYMDITYRRFCVYGGGHGEKTRVLNTDVSVYIPTTLNKPHGMTLANPYYHQSLFDIAGGGYSGDVGYWESNGLDPSDPDYDAYDHYVGGNCKVTIDGYTYARKVIGGGFYGSCYRTDMDVRCGSLRQIYGGSLLGYVHHSANLRFGNRTQDFLPGFEGDYSVYSEAELADAAAQAKALNDYLFVTENMYGGNDVKGIVGTTRWYDASGKKGFEAADGAPLFAADIDPDNDKGIFFNIYGGTFMGDVYGAGNGHYRGYYVPEWTRYNDGPARMYTDVRSAKDPSLTGRVYRARPMVGTVNIVIQGNSDRDKVTIWGDFYGGGRSCTIGQWNTLLPFEDPRRLVKGGYLHVNLGSNVEITGALYMGADGRGFSEQTLLPAGKKIDLNKYYTTTKQLEDLGDAAYGHWYYNTTRHRYEPGFPIPGEVDGNYGMTGEHMLRGYMKNIEMPGDVEITFYSDPYKVDDNGKYVYNSKGRLERKHWVPAERAVNEYDAVNVKMHDFFLGGRAGSMTNNNVMYYNYTQGTATFDLDQAEAAGDKLEKYGAIYRVTLPRGVTLVNAAVMGSRDAGLDYYPYNSDYTGYITDDGHGNAIEPYFGFDGGITTQSPLTYDVIVYNDVMQELDEHHVIYIGLPDDFYTDDTNNIYTGIRNNDSHTMRDGTVISRKKYSLTDSDGNPHFFPNWQTSDGIDLSNGRYDLAVTEINGVVYAFAGQRETRDAKTAVKSVVACQFELEDIPDPSLAPQTEIEDANGMIIKPYTKTGGIVYGGCYKSGITMGDVVLIVGGNLLGNIAGSTNEELFKDLASLQYNLGRVYGGGYGERTVIKGDTYVNLLLNFTGMNVFGGGLGGEVTGSTTVNYKAAEDSYVYGSIYGGALYGQVGTGYRVFDDEGTLINCLDYGVLDNDNNPTPAVATNVNLVSGNVSRVFGGSCLAQVFGSTNVLLQDQALQELNHLDLEQFEDFVQSNFADMSLARLIAGSVYGGNDIAGNIYTFGDTVHDTIVNVTEYKKPDEDVHLLSPGSADGYNGFPLIGSLYAAGNGNYCRVENGVYADPDYEMILYMGHDNNNVNVDTNGWHTLKLNGVHVPDVRNAQLNINGGTIISAYCGGNRATVNGHVHANVNYKTHDARAGFDNSNAVNDPLRIWNLLSLSSQEQFKEVLDHNDDEKFTYKYQIYHMFAGNDHADMAIQPEVNLIRGHIGSVYSGGNNGRMTYWRYDEAENRNVGLEFTVNSPDIHIEELYGGGRIGDIIALDPATGNPVAFGPTEYGATLNIHAGLIEAAYGGNDVCGTVYNGSNVNIYGAISGDVYGAGNGNYLYMIDNNLPIDSGVVVEDYDDENFNGRYFRLSPKTTYFGTDFNPNSNKKISDAQRILCINSYRPNSDKTYLNIHGSEDNRVWVKGNVYCGGNSSTIYTDLSDHTNTVRFNVGDYVILNSVFLGSNGERLADTRDDGMMLLFEKANGLQLDKKNDLPAAFALPARDRSAHSMDHYPTLLSLYMRAVEVNGKPDEFKFDITKDKVTYVGDFCLGGNRGSMMADETINMTLPEKLTIFGNVVGGCYDTEFEFRSAHHTGGMTQFLNPAKNSTPQFADEMLDLNNKVWLTLKCDFAPLKLEYPMNGDIFSIDLVEDLVETNGKKHYSANRCNVYGGCYRSGLTVGDIRIDLYSNMGENVDPQYILNGLEQGFHTFDIVGGGYGKRTMVYGNTKVHMLPGKTTDSEGNEVHTSPRAASIFGGSQEGVIIGNTHVMIRDGHVLTNVYGGSESAIMYGSTNVMIGYPITYRCRKTGVYLLNRADHYSAASVDAENPDIVKKKIWLLKDDVVGANIYEAVVAREDMEPDETHDDWFGEPLGITPDTFGATWDDIDISIGENNLYDLDAPYYGNGNVYGGGYITNNSDTSLAGTPTVKKYDNYTESIAGTSRQGYGGNSTVLIADNTMNNKPDFTGAPGMALRDHISIGTARLNKVVLSAGQNKVGKYYVDETKTGFDRFIHQESGLVTEEDVAAGRNVYYSVEADGGIYGGGRKVFVEGFRSCDMFAYGYAEHSPQHPKHLNTIQRVDLLTLRDCCLQLVGAPDHASAKVDATPYSMTRVGELRMISSLDKSKKLDTGVDLTVDKDPDDLDPRVDKPGYLMHNTPRTRNYLGFFNDIRFVGAIYSSTDFDDDYHDANGEIVTDEHYRTYKSAMVQDRNSENILNFPKRNVGTSHNMIGINNGYKLKIQGYYEDDEPYYGPILGVVEVKLLTLLPQEGGGYIYALNKHDNITRNLAPGQREVISEPWVEYTGNFVYPGRMFTATGDEKHYMYDDCLPLGYDTMTEMGANPDGWKDEEVHYWYVSGNNYYFTTTLTAYTYNRPKEFFLNNYDGLLMLSGIEPGVSDINVKSVTWGTHRDNMAEDYECDLTDYADETPGEEKYKLYISVDKNSEINHKDENDHTTTEGAWAARLTRSDFDSSAQTTSADGITPNTSYNGTYDNTDDATNLPIVGIMLADNVDNSDPEYYKKHLSEPDNVTIVLEATRPDEHGNDIVTTYTINLTILYLQGPNITGDIVIDNCALPGEIISANTGDMTISLSEELFVEDRKWIVQSPDKLVELDVTDYRDAADYTRLNLPVWSYNNDWNLYYRVKINGEIFDVGTNPEAEHTNITVHNYHRMKAMYGDSEIYQVLTPGARIYIEDQADLDRFITFADSLSMVSHQPRIITGSTLVDRPRNCEGLIFILQNNLTLPKNHVMPAKFAGQLLGFGHNLTAEDATPLFGELCEEGTVRDLGFISTGDGHIVQDLNGKMFNCFLYNALHRGGPYVNLGTTALYNNCHQNINPADADTYSSDHDFRYGRVAYNLNSYYLKGRYDLLLNPDADPHVELLDEIYHDGDYRYAYWDSEYGIGQPTALRNRARPNYMNYERTGQTNHNIAHPQDVNRYVPAVIDDETGDVVEEEYWHPLWRDDYMMFSQNLALNSTDLYPTPYNPDYHVYRASGFYGSKVDTGFHFNINAAAGRPDLTAIDFTGYRDAGHDPDLARTIDAENDVFCRPMLDLPAPKDANYGIPGVTVLSNGDSETYDAITRNLLVYADDKFDPATLIAVTADAQTGIRYLPGTLTYNEDDAEENLVGHLLMRDADGNYLANAGLLHLVDKQDFNAPIPFGVESRAWYERTPADYSTGDNRWEGICLPFAANRVEAHADALSGTVRNHGEITHFYGEEVPYDTPNVNNRLHEYWLRSLISHEGDDLVFARPGMTDFKDETGATRHQLVADYHYSNIWFPTAFGDEYIAEHNQYTRTGTDFPAYHFLTESTPYLITFPSKRYYEFDLSGEFYQEFHNEIETYPMTILYEYLTSARRDNTTELEDTHVGADAALDVLTIGVSDDTSRCVSDGTWYFTGTFARKVLDKASQGVLNDDGDAFRRCNNGEEVLPFRTFLSSTGYIKSPKHIAAPAPDIIETPGHEDEGDANPIDSIRFAIRNNVLIADSPADMYIPLCDTSGRIMRFLDIKEGHNEFPDIEQGVYMAGSYKFYIR